MPYKRRYPKKKAPITKKYQRKKMAVQRMPFVEQKFKETAEVGSPKVAPTYSLTQDTNTRIPDVFEFMSQGDTSSTISGRWIYSKWLTTKMMIDFTPCVAEHTPMTFILYQGWCKLNLNPELPIGGGPIPSLSQAELQSHVSKVLGAAYEDPLGTGDARRIQIIKKMYIKSSPRTVVHSAHEEIFRQNQMVNLKWNVQRKIRYNHCTTGPPETPGTSFMQCNTGNWVPFIMFQRSPTDASPLAAYPLIHYKDRHYFTDS